MTLYCTRTQGQPEDGCETKTPERFNKEIKRRKTSEGWRWEREIKTSTYISLQPKFPQMNAARELGKENKTVERWINLR